MRGEECPCSTCSVFCAPAPSSGINWTPIDSKNRWRARSPSCSACWLMYSPEALNRAPACIEGAHESGQRVR